MDLKHFVDNEQTTEELNLIWETAKKIKELYYSDKAGRKLLKEIADERHITAVFNQPSTRTSFKFCLAGKMLGASVELINEISYTSMVKGESWYNTLRTFSEKGTDIMTIRHPVNHVPRQLASLCKRSNFPVSIISGGDGNNLHPTQGLGDVFTIKEHFGERFGKEALKIVIGADPKNSRVFHSLVRVLANYPINLTVVAWRTEPSFRMPRKYLREFAKRNGMPREVNELSREERFDVIYWTRYQIEHGPKEPEGLKEKQQEEYNQKYRITPSFLKEHLKPDGIFLHPGPRTEEIDIKIDKDPRVKDGEQMRNGDFITAALYALLLSPEFHIPEIV